MRLLWSACAYTFVGICRATCLCACKDIHSSHLVSVYFMYYKFQFFSCPNNKHILASSSHVHTHTHTYTYTHTHTNSYKNTHIQTYYLKTPDKQCFLILECFLYAFCLVFISLVCYFPNFFIFHFVTYCFICICYALL